MNADLLEAELHPPRVMVENVPPVSVLERELKQIRKNIFEMSEDV